MSSSSKDFHFKFYMFLYELADLEVVFQLQESNNPFFSSFL